jgi:hypothetical protein
VRDGPARTVQDLEDPEHRLIALMLSTPSSHRIECLESRLDSRRWTASLYCAIPVVGRRHRIRFKRTDSQGPLDLHQLAFTMEHFVSSCAVNQSRRTTAEGPGDGSKMHEKLSLCFFSYSNGPDRVQ